MTIKQHFKEFLQKEGAYEEFCDELESAANVTFRQFTPMTYEYMTSGHFHWEESNQGYDYWSKLDAKWRNHLKTIECTSQRKIEKS